MTDTTDLVARLRTCNPWDDAPSEIAETLDNAAATIERLTRDLQSAALDAIAAHGQAADNYTRAVEAEARIAKLEAALDDFVREQQSEAQAGTGEYQRGYDDCIADHADRARAALKEPS
jgi:hypothetical protein